MAFITKDLGERGYLESQADKRTRWRENREAGPARSGRPTAALQG